MIMEQELKKSDGFRLYVFTFIGLSVLTLLAVGVSQIRVTSLVAIGLILLIASVQAIIVLFYNMHLKFHEKILVLFVGVVFALILLLIIITMLDFDNR